MKLNLDKLETEISSKIANENFDLEYLEFVQDSGNNILRVVIDNINGNVSIDDCEKISRLIEDDVDKYIDVEYILEVSSAGLERQLKNIKLFKKYEGKEIYLKLYKKSEYGKELNGLLEKVDQSDKKIILNKDNKKLVIYIKDIAVAHTTFDFSNAFKKKDNVNINKLKKF